MIMKGYTFFYLFICIFTFTGCGIKSDSYNENEYVVRVKVKRSELNLQGLFSDYELIFLEGEKIGKIKKLFCKEDKIIVWTGSGSKRIHSYNCSSQEQAHFAEIGRSPDEYYSIRDVYVEDTSLYILDFIRKSIDIVTHEGKFIRRVGLPEFCDNASPFDNARLVIFKKVPYRPKRNFKITILEEDGESFRHLHDFIPVQEVEAERDFYQLAPLYKFNDKLRFTEAFSEIIYTVHEDRMEPTFKLDFGNKALPYQKYMDEDLNLMEFAEHCMKSGCIWDINCVLENQRYLFFVFRSFKEVYGVFFDKKLKTSSVFNTLNDNVALQVDKLSLNEGFIPMVMTDSSMYFVVEPYFLEELKMRNSKQIRPESDVLGSSIDSLNYALMNVELEDNPVILKYNFRKHDE